MNERRAPRARGAAAVAFAVVVLGLLAYLVLASPIFQVSTIQVLGNRRLSDASIRRMTGATVGDSLVLAPIDDIESSVESS
ncbi:MAG TPA: FtsQ-type POTRA domain-containing protein, partial [Actinomycetota bacterium]|nr:FtsQ-type POTRA domain-containing protein [Actinomycetota bacterium]